METNLQNNQTMHETMRRRVLELEMALKNLIEEHRSFQIDEELKKYEAILNKQVIKTKVYGGKISVNSTFKAS